jgi:MoxR-like ATPase
VKIAESSPIPVEDNAALEKARVAVEAIRTQLKRRIVGQTEVIDRLLISLFARGHCLIIGVPGLAKTRLIATLAEAIDLDFKRVQFTPDLMPSDITGTEILEEDSRTGKRGFRFIPGPVFCNILLADEINRTPPKTQAALLQAMQEGEVTAGGQTHPLSPPFLVLATQNPIEQEGTYPLPEAQLDRFMFSVHVEYPSFEDEVMIVQSTTTSHNEAIEAVLSPAEILELQDLVLRIPVAEPVVAHAVSLVQASRPRNDGASDFVQEYVAWGAGPRASQFLILGAKARALLDGRAAASIDDVRALAHGVLQHRIVPNFHAEAERIETQRIVDEILDATPAHATVK